jgi:hypothetical protein
VPGHTIVLVPGLLAPSLAGRLVFANIPRVLEQHHCSILFTSAPLMAGIDQRARVLRDQIIKHFGLGTGALPKPTVHLIGKSTMNLKNSMLINRFIPHWTGVSLGGLACRKLATMPNLEFDIMSVTTVGTPHQGTGVASVVNKITLRNNLLLHSSYTSH